MLCCFAGILGDNVKITKDKTKVTVVTETQFSKRCHMSMPCDALNCLPVVTDNWPALLALLP